MKKIVLLVFMVFSFAGLSAQKVEFTADRPGASTGPSVVSKGVIQWEQGVQYDGDGAKGSFTFSNTLFRYGLFDGVELRMGGDAFSYDYFGNWKSAFRASASEQRFTAAMSRELFLQYRYLPIFKYQELAPMAL